MTSELASTGGPRIPEGPEDMPGGPDGGTPIRPPDRKKQKEKRTTAKGATRRSRTGERYNRTKSRRGE